MDHVLTGFTYVHMAAVPGPECVHAAVPRKRCVKLRVKFSAQDAHDLQAKLPRIGLHKMRRRQGKWNVGYTPAEAFFGHNTLVHGKAAACVSDEAAEQALAVKLASISWPYRCVGAPCQ